MKLAYPAIFTPYEDKTGGYTVEFPDLPGCVTDGKDLADAIFMAVDVASGWILTELEDGNKAPAASDIHSVKVPEGSVLSMVALDMDAYAEKYGKKAVKKTLTIPAWLNTYVEENGISCSRVLQETLSRMAQG